MGKTSNNEIIDETFVGLLEPKEVHELGREDITEGRPGQSLLQIVQDFGKKGFDGLVEKRARERELLEKSDVKHKNKQLADFGLKGQDEGMKSSLAIDDNEA